MNALLDVEADMVPPLVTNHTVCACGRVDTRDWLGTTHTYEPIASRAPPKALASPAGLGRARFVASHTQTSLAHWNPSRAGLASETRT
jgi:hypothetical protein